MNPRCRSVWITPDLPRPGLVLAGREERDEIDRLIARRDHLLEPRLVHPEPLEPRTGPRRTHPPPRLVHPDLLEQRTGLVGIHLRRLGFDRREDADRADNCESRRHLRSL